MGPIIIRFCYVSILACLTFACGAADMPGSGLGSRTSATGTAVQPSSETTFDLTKCGFDLTKPGSTISSRRMSMVPKTMQVTAGIFPIATSVTISGMAIFED